MEKNSLKEYWLPQNLTSGFGFPVKGTKSILLLATYSNNNYYDDRIQSNCQNNTKYSTHVDSLGTTN